MSIFNKKHSGQAFNEMLKQKQVVLSSKWKVNYIAETVDKSEDARKYLSLWTPLIQVRSVIWKRDFAKDDNFCILTAATVIYVSKPGSN